MFDDAEQIQTRICKRPGSIGEADERKHRARRPNFGVSGTRSFQGGKRQDHVAYRSRTD